MPTLLVQSRDVHRPSIIQPTGSLNAQNVAQFFDEVNRVVAHSPHSYVLVDMKRVDNIDSAGLMALVSAFRLAQTANKRFLVCSVTRTVRMILELTQLDEVLEIVENPLDISEALS